MPPPIWDERLAHELVLPIWKSNVSLTLMLDKRAKRYERVACRHPSSRAQDQGPELISDVSSISALSLRIFGEDITSAARDAAAKKKQQGETVPEVAADTPVLDENADASDLAEATGVDQASD